MGFFLTAAWLIGIESSTPISAYVYYLFLTMSDKILGKGAVEVELLDQNNQSRVIRLINALNNAVSKS